MQGLPFDENDFATPVATSSSTWIEHSPPAPTNATVTDEELYGIVAGPSPSASQVPNPDVIQRLSQQMPIPATAPTTAASLYVSLPMPSSFQQRHQSHPQPHHQTALSHHSQPQHLHQSPIPSRISQSQNPNSYLAASKSPLQHQSNRVSQHRTSNSVPQNASNHLEPKRVKRMSQPIDAPDLQGATHPKQQLRPHKPSLITTAQGIVGPSTGVLPSKESARRPVRSAVEEARLRAQREAESFANSRRDPAKREASLAVVGSHSDASGKDGVGERRSSKRSRHEGERSSDGQACKTGPSRASGDDKAKHEDDSEAEKQERYKRRLDMNRESAAVSRVRRRAYVKELEERLAAVEAEKLQLEGKLEIMMSQNESFKKQLDNLFLMVTSGGRPNYPPPPPQGDGAQ